MYLTRVSARSGTTLTRQFPVIVPLLKRPREFPTPAISAALLVTDSLMPQASTRTDAFYHHTALQVRLQNEIGPNIASALLPKTSCSSVLNPLDSREYRFRIKPSYPV